MSAVLLIEDNAPLRRALRASFRTSDYRVLEAANGEDALTMVASERPDLVVLDLRLPGLDGIDTLRHLRSFSAVPVIVLTVVDDLHTKLAALDSGADDYVVKPFEPPELLARARAQLRRAVTRPEQPAALQIGELNIDLARDLITWRGERISLTPTEHRLLQVFLADRGRLLTREHLLNAVWGPDGTPDYVRLRVTLVSLRRKLHDDASNPALILTEPGLGYRWIGDEDANPRHPTP